MMKYVAIALALGLVGCKDLTGKLNVHDRITLNETKWGKTKPVVLAKGQYNVELDRKGDKILEVTIRTDKKHEFEFNTPRGIPTSGAFELPGSVTGQPVDIAGNITVTSTVTGPFRDREPCQTHRDQVVCDPRGCFPQRVPYTGYREVQYKLETIHQSLTAQVANLGGDVTVADLNGSRSDSIRHYLYQGACW